MKTSALAREFRLYALSDRGLQPGTVRDVLVIVTRLTAFSRTEDLQKLTTPLIQSFLRHGRIEKGWGIRTFRLYRQYLKTFFQWCVRAGHLEGNPVTPIDKPRLPESLPRCLSHREAKRVLYAARHASWSTELQRCRSEAIVATFLMAGLRRAELLRLEVTDLSFRAGTLTVRAGKGRKDRTIPLHPQLVPLLLGYLEEKERQKLDSPLLFSSLRSEKPLTEKNLYALLERVARKARVKFTPHMLRHTFGRELVEADFNVYKLKEVMGHASVGTTQTYVALSSKSIKESFEQTRIY